MICPFFRPFSLIWRGIKYLAAIFSFSLIVYDSSSITSILSLSGAGIKLKLLAVAINSTFDKSNGISR